MDRPVMHACWGGQSGPLLANQHERRWWLGALLTGIGLRVLNADRLAIEHWDEAVYAANIAFPLEQGGQAPFRELYAPFLWPAVLECVQTLAAAVGAGPFGLVAMLPGIVCGVLTIVLAGWAARCWWSPPAGVAVAWLVALNEFHVAYSTTALTDVPVSLAILGAVWAASRRLAGGGWWWSLAAAGLTLIAWWTKYLGWLPVAIVLSGGAADQLLRPRPQQRWSLWAMTTLAVGIGAALAFLGILWDCQNLERGYLAVSANHRGYVRPWSDWFVNWSRQTENYAAYALWLSAWSWMTALYAARCLRATTIDTTAAVSPGLATVAKADRKSARALSSPTVATKATDATGEAPSVSRGALLRESWPMALFALTLLASVWTQQALGFVALGAVAAIVVAIVDWWQQRRLSAHDHAPDQAPPPAFRAAARNLRSEPVEASHSVSPSASRWHLGPSEQTAGALIAAWFLGLLLATPRYAPYPRLLIPLWLAAMLLAGWLIHRRQHWLDRLWPRTSPTGTLFVMMGLGAALLADWSSLREDRRCFARAAQQIDDQLAHIDGGPAFVTVSQAPALFLHLSHAGIACMWGTQPQPPSAGLSMATFLAVPGPIEATSDWQAAWARVAPAFERPTSIPLAPSRLYWLDAISPAEWERQGPATPLHLYRARNR